jgi:hypothetical protein
MAARQRLLPELDPPHHKHFSRQNAVDIREYTALDSSLSLANKKHSTPQLNINVQLWSTRILFFLFCIIIKQVNRCVHFGLATETASPIDPLKTTKAPQCGVTNKKGLA